MASAGQLITTFRSSQDSQSAALAAQAERVRHRVIPKYATGNGNINNDFFLDAGFRLVFVRAHFVAGSGTAAMSLFMKSTQGTAYDTRLHSLTTAGTNNDVFFSPGGDDVADPSPWSFQVGDKLNIKWTNPAPGTMTWGLEVGLAIAA